MCIFVSYYYLTPQKNKLLWNSLHLYNFATFLTSNMRLENGMEFVKCLALRITTLGIFSERWNGRDGTNVQIKIITR